MDNVDNPLKTIPIFSKLNEAELDLIYRSMSKRTYPPNTVIFFEEDVPDGLYLVMRGRVKISLMDENGREITLSTLKGGRFFGEMALFDESPRSADVETLEETDFLVLKKSHFLEMIEKSPSIARNILKEMSGRLREADDKIRNLALYDVAGRLARILIDIAKKEGVISKEKNVATLPELSQQELANMIGTSRETVSRVLNRFQERGLVTITRKQIILHNIDSLL
jgi:CRP/FNR family transcriptional regulator